MMKIAAKYPRWIAVLIWMSIIFYLSAQDASDSSALSSGFTKKILEILEIFIRNLQTENLHHAVRKGAHFAAYLFLGVLVTHAMEETNKKTMILTMLICVLYAASDEFHQRFVPGRSGQLSDVLLDSSGSLTGILAYLQLEYLIRKEKRKTNILQHKE